VVKPERATLQLSGSKPTTLRVHLQNNFPFKLLKVEMRGSASGYKIEVSPQDQDINPGQRVAYTFKVTRTSGASGAVAVKSLNLQARFRIGFWRGESDPLVNPNPTEASLIAGTTYSKPTQGASLNAAYLADKYPNATIPSHVGRTGLEQLITWFGYPFCYNNDGYYRCGAQDCPSPCAEGKPYDTRYSQFAQQCMRAGLELALRKAKLGNQLAATKAAALNALTSATSEAYKCLSAVVGGMLWRKESDTATLKSALKQAPAACQAAALRLLGQGQAPADCSVGPYYERATCAAAEGLLGDDGPVKKILMPNAGDGSAVLAYSTQYFSYMLYLVTHDRYASGQQPSFYPAVASGVDQAIASDAAAPDAAVDGSVDTTPPAVIVDQGGGCTLLGRRPAPYAAGLLLVPLLLLGLHVLRRRRRRHRRP
jgi:hypothetical protein